MVMKYVNDDEFYEIQHKIVEALSHDYLNVYLVNPEKRTFRIIKLEGYVTKGVENNSKVYSYEEICQNYINARVYSDDRSMMKEALDINTVLKKLETRQEYKGSYRTLNSDNQIHYYQYKFIKMEKDSDIIVGFQNVDEIVTSERKQAEKLTALLEEERIKNSVISSLSSAYFCIYYIDLITGQFKELRPAALPQIDHYISKTGDARENFVKMANFLVKPAYKEAIIEFTDLSTLPERLKNKNSIGIHFDGAHEDFCEGIFIVAERNNNGNCTHVLLVIRSIKDEMEKEIKYRKQLAESLKETEHQKELLQKALADFQKADNDRRTDFLTGLKNRQDMFELLSNAEVESKKIDAMFMMDIDNFKMLNDTYGHLYGDNCLRLIGSALNDYGRKNNMYFCRYGGEEMLGISFDGCKNPDLIAKELVTCISDLGIKRNDTNLGVVTISLGYTTDNSDYENMLKKADTALYSAKANGKNKAVSFE